MKRTHISKINLKEAEKNKNNIKVSGFIENIRNHGEIIFMDLKNEDNVLQLVFNPNIKNFDILKHLKTNSTITCEGYLILRDADRINSKINTGLYELKVENFKIVSYAEPSPIDNNTINENILLKYRNINLRNSNLQNTLKYKSKIMKSMRQYLEKEDFIEFETPILTRTTPGGAKDFLTLSSQKKQNVFGLVQSPQLFKQLLMTSGFEKYYQFAKCFRDEELRSDRQPEFLQLDIEASWMEEEDIINLISNMIIDVEKNIFNTDIKFKDTISYDTAIDKYGSDKPDLRFNLELVNITNILKNTNFSIFKEVINKGGVVKTITIPADHYSKKQRKEIEKFAISHGASGLGYLLISNGEIVSPLLKFLTETEINQIMEVSNYNENNNEVDYTDNRIIYFIADNKEQVAKLGNELRNKFGKDLGLKTEEHVYLWVNNFPMFEKKQDGSIAAMHHPFTKPYISDIKKYERGEIDILEIKTYSYDLVLNGSEIGGGSVRIEDVNLQEKIFDLLKLSNEEREALDWFIQLFKYGVPEHAGFAMGVDRLVQKLLNKDTIRDSIPFPKNSISECPLSNSPSKLSKTEFLEYGLKYNNIIKK